MRGLPGKCERIIKTPVPFSFVLHLRTIILVYVRAWLASRTVDTHMRGLVILGSDRDPLSTR